MGIFGIIVIIIIFALVQKVMKDAQTGKKSSYEKIINAFAKDEKNPKTEEKPEEKELAPARFIYYDLLDGRRRVDTVASNRLTGRELSEYEILLENRRLDALYVKRLEELDVQRQSVYEAAPPETEVPDVPPAVTEAPKWSSEEKQREAFHHSSDYDQDAYISVGSSTEERLEQLERYLESGLITKKEYKEQKAKLRHGK